MLRRDPDREADAVELVDHLDDAPCARIHQNRVVIHDRVFVLHVRYFDLMQLNRIRQRRTDREVDTQQADGCQRLLVDVFPDHFFAFRRDDGGRAGGLGSDDGRLGVRRYDHGVLCNSHGRSGKDDECHGS